jgi:hypothetical protein
MAFLTDATFQMKGHTVLYIPSEELPNPDLAAKSKDVVQRLESLVIHWTRQIKEVVNIQHTSETSGTLLIYIFILSFLKYNKNIALCNRKYWAS